MSDLSIGATALTVDQQLMNLDRPGERRQRRHRGLPRPGGELGRFDERHADRQRRRNHRHFTPNQQHFGNGFEQRDQRLPRPLSVRTPPGSAAGSNRVKPRQRLHQRSAFQLFQSGGAAAFLNPNDSTPARAFFIGAHTPSRFGTGSPQYHQSGHNDLVAAKVSYSQGQQQVASANGLISEIANLNSTIQNATAQGTDVNDLQDQRDQRISQLAEIVNVQTVPQGQGVVNVIVGGVPVVMGNKSAEGRLQYNTADGANNPATWR